jgi:hypothetical protein
MTPKPDITRQLTQLWLYRNGSRFTPLLMYAPATTPQPVDSGSV